jgi:hypothetical protein
MGQLTPMWAQDAIGSSESRELMSGLTPSPREVKVGVLDGSFLPGAMPMNAVTPELRACMESGPPENCGFTTTMSAADEAALRKNIAANRKYIAGGSYHGTAVSNLIAGDPPVSVGRQARIFIPRKPAFCRRRACSACSR